MYGTQKCTGNVSRLGGRPNRPFGLASYPLPPRLTTSSCLQTYWKPTLLYPCLTPPPCAPRTLLPHGIEVEESRCFAALGIPGGRIPPFIISAGVLHLNQFSGAKLWEAVRPGEFALPPTFYHYNLWMLRVCRALRWQKFQAHLGPANFWNIYRMTLAGFSALFSPRPRRRTRAPTTDRAPKTKSRSRISSASTCSNAILDAASTAVLAAVGLLIFESSGHLDAPRDRSGL